MATQGGVYNAGKKSGKNEYPFLFLGGEGNGNAVQYSCLENPMDGGAWWAKVHRVAKSQTRLSDFTFFPYTPLGGGRGRSEPGPLRALRTPAAAAKSL